MPSWRVNDEKLLVGHWPFSGHARDVSGHGYHGTLYNTPTWGKFLNGRTAIELDGNDQYSNVGDVLELNAVEKFTICFWMAQDVLGATDYIFYKDLDATHRIRIYTTGGVIATIISDGVNAIGSYAPAYVAGEWVHFASVFDGSQVGNAARLVMYENGVPAVLVFGGTTIPAATADLSGQDATIGTPTVSLDGKLYDYRIYSGAALSRQEVRQVIDVPVPFEA